MNLKGEENIQEQLMPFDWICLSVQQLKSPRLHLTRHLCSCSRVSCRKGRDKSMSFLGRRLFLCTIETGMKGRALGKSVKRRNKECFIFLNSIQFPLLILSYLGGGAPCPEMETRKENRAILQKKTIPLAVNRKTLFCSELLDQD